MDQQGQALRLLMMYDELGKYLLVVPAELVLKSDLIEAATGRQLKSVAPAALQRYFRQSGMRRAEGQAKLFDSLPLIADTRVVSDGAMLVEASTGMLFDPDLTETRLLEMPRAELGTLLSSVESTEDSLEEQVKSALSVHTQKRIGDRIEETLSIPTLSPTARKLLELRSDQDAGIDQLVPIVSTDPSLSAQVLAWANSPMFAAPGRAKSVDDAVVRILGYDLVLNLSISLLLGKELNFETRSPRGAVPYWMRSLATARLAELLARQIPVTRRPSIGLVYLCGLLHNFGTLILAHLFPPHYAKLCRSIELNPHIEQWRLERNILGIDGAQLAAWLFNHWRLPESLVEAIEWQHQPDRSSQKSPLAMLICLCNRLLREQGLSDGPVEPLPESITDLLGLHYHQIDAVVQEFETMRQDIEATVAQLNQ